MSTRARLLGALAACTLGSCDPGAPSVTPATTPPRPTLQAEAPREAPRPGAAVPHAMAPLVHPNDARDDDSLGSRVTPRRLPIPRVGLGRSATFRFSGQRRGWVLQLAEGQQLITPAYADGKVYVGAGFTSTTVYALDATTGVLRWQADTPDGGPSGAIVDDKTVLFNTESCTLFAFDTRTGRQRWSNYLGDPLMSQPVSGGGRVFTAWPSGNHPGGFAFGALSMRNGRVLWSRAVTADVMTAPVVAGDAVYATLMDGTVARWRTTDGRRLWSRRVGATSAPAVDGGHLYVAQRVDRGHERPMVLNALTGAVETRGDGVRAGYVAQRPDTGGTEPGWAWEGSRPAVADGRVYQAMGDEIVARSQSTGAVVWRKRNPMGGAVRGVTSPAVVGSQLVVGTRGGDLFGLDIDSGQTTWAVRVGEPIGFQPAVANGWVYVATMRGKVLGLEIGDRSLDGWHMWGGNAAHTGLSAAEAAAPEAERPTSGELRTVSASGDRLPMVHTDVDATVEGPVARVTVTQEFGNPHAQPIDAEYLFPLPGDAAVDAMELRVGARVIQGSVQTRGDARRTYQQARVRGRTAALLEQERPNLFRQAVANIRPGERVSVRLRYVQTVPWREGRYELVMPLRSGATGALATQPVGDASVRATVGLGVALENIGSPSHEVSVTGSGAGPRSVALRSGRVAADRDYVLRYAPAVSVAAPSVLTSEGPDGRYLTLQIHPDARVPEGMVTPREVVFAVDTSSSMRGRSLEQAKAVLRASVRALRAGDAFRVLAFSDVVTPLSAEALVADDASRARALAFIDGLQAAGATGLRAGLDAALAGAATGGRMKVVVVVSDGYVGDERAVLAGVRGALGASRVFTLGVGSAVNRYLLETIAEEGRGEAVVVAPGDDAAAVATRFAAMIDRPSLTDVSVDFGDLDVREAFPRVMPDLYADRPVVLHARYTRGGRGTIRVRGLVAGRPWERAVEVDLPASSGDAGARSAWDRDALPSLWARSRVKELTRAMLLGEVAAMRDEVTSLGLRFGLVTEYTSFVAVDEGPAQRAVAGGRASTGAAVPSSTPAAVVSRAASASLSLDDAVGGGVGYGAAHAQRAVMSSSMIALAAPSAPVGRAAEASPRPVRPPPRMVEAPEPADSQRERLSTQEALMARIRPAVARVARENPALRGRVRIEFTIDADGRVTRVRALEGEEQWAALVAALVTATEGAPLTATGEEATIVVPIVVASDG